MTFRSAYCAFAAVVILMCPCMAQDEKPWQFPSALRLQMDERLRQFTQAQAAGHWDEVARLLGDYRRGSSGYIRYTSAHKKCLVQTMKESPMVAFDYRIQESLFSSEILSTPPNRRWWTLIGDGTFRTASGHSKRDIAVVAYRDGEGWFFTPPPLDNMVLRALVTQEDLAADRKGAVKIRIPSDAPLYVVALHVHIDPMSLSSRNIEFRFHNKTGKKVTAYSFVLDDEKEDGSISVATGAESDAILPQGDSRVWKESHNAFLYRCEGEGNIRITLEGVTFADGTDWTPNKHTPN